MIHTGRGAQTVGRQIEHRQRATEPAKPVRPLAVERAGVQPPLLPRRIIPILDRQGRPPGLAAITRGMVERGQTGQACGCVGVGRS